MAFGYLNAKLSFGAIVQTSQGTIEGTLAGITSTWSGHGGRAADASANLDQGLLLGDTTQGINNSGVNVVLGRRSIDKAMLDSAVTAPTYTRPHSEPHAYELRTLTVAFPWVGNRDDAAGTPVVNDTIPLKAVDAILRGCGMVDATTGVNTRYRFGAGLHHYTCLLCFNSAKILLIDCLTQSLVVNYVMGETPIAVATIQGLVHTPSVSTESVFNHPTLTYADQGLVAAPVAENMSYDYNGTTRGANSIQLAITNNIVIEGDSNSVYGEQLFIDGTDVTCQVKHYVDTDATNEVTELYQLLEDNPAAVHDIGWLHGTVATASSPVNRITALIPELEITESGPDVIGPRAAWQFTGIARHNTLVNRQLDIIFD